MATQSLLIELLLAGFFAVACFRARATQSPDFAGIAPRRLFGLISRVERLRRTRWQWFSMVLFLVLVRLQFGAALVVELTAAAEFMLFVALPSVQPVEGVAHT